MAELFVNDAPSWKKWVTDFDKSYRLFGDNYNGLLMMRDYVYNKHPELSSQYNQLVADGQKNKTTLDKLKQTRDAVVNWLTGIENALGAPINALQQAGANALSWLKQTFNLHGLALAPVIVAVGIGSAISALAIIGYWITDAYKFAQKLNALQDLERNGVPAGTAADIINKVANGQGFLGIPWKWIVVGAVAIVLGPPILRSITGRR